MRYLSSWNVRYVAAFKKQSFLKNHKWYLKQRWVGGEELRRCQTDIDDGDPLQEVSSSGGDVIRSTKKLT